LKSAFSDDFWDLVKQGGSIFKVVLKQEEEEDKGQDNNGEIVSNVRNNGDMKHQNCSTEQ